MAEAKFDLGGYVTVAERIQKFYAANPDGRILAGVPEIVSIGDKTYLQVRASVLRSPEDRCPVVATAWEPYPGRTPYTRESEAMNAETSAVGRALALAGIEVQRDIASAEEAQNRQERQERQEVADAGSPPVGAAIAAAFYKSAEKAGVDRDTIDSWAMELAGVASLPDVPKTHWNLLRDKYAVYLQERKSTAPANPRPPFGGDAAPAPSDGETQAPESNGETELAPEGAVAGAVELGSRARKS